MAFILRWPAVLVLLALAFLSFAGALAAASAITNFQVEVQQIQAAQVAAEQAGATWLDVGLWAGAGLFFLIAGIRLIRRTQGFWAWLIAFALFGGRWAYAQRMDFDTIVQQFDPTIYMRPQEVVADLGAPAAQVGLLGIVLIVGLLAFIVDAVDRAHWNNQGA